MDDVVVVQVLDPFSDLAQHDVLQLIRSQFYWIFVDANEIMQRPIAQFREAC